MEAVKLVSEMEKLEKGLRDFAYLLTRDRVDASDLYQETAYKAFKNLKQFKSNYNLKGWLMTIMRNTFINNHRKRKTRQKYHESNNNDYLLNNSGSSTGNSGELTVNYNDLVELVDHLEPYLSKPFMLMFQGYKYDEIADQLDTPLGTVKSRIHIARKQLRKMVEQKYHIPEMLIEA